MAKDNLKDQERKSKIDSKIIEEGYSEVRKAFSKDESSKKSEKNTKRQYYI